MTPDLILVTLIMFAVCGVIGMFAACWIRAHDGSMTSTSQLAEDIREDT
jgi:hypothetical protein